MKYKELGDTGLEVPEIGLGTSRYTGGEAPLRRGISLGAFLIDTAELYQTEDVVGLAVQPMRKDVFIATKVWSTHFRYDDVIEAAENSLKRLGTHYIDLYQLHKPNPDVPIEETMGAMDRLVEDGKVRFIGVSNFSVDQLKGAQAASKSKIVSNQVHYSLVERGIERDLLPYCQENSVTIIAYGPLAASRGIAHIRSSLREGALESVARATGKSEAQVALNWCISRPSVNTIPKSDSAERIEENCGASGWRLTSEQIEILERPP